MTCKIFQKISSRWSLTRKFAQMLSVVLFATCGTSVFAATPIPDNATLRVAAEACLTEAPINGLCSVYGSTSGYGEMPNWDTSKITDMKGLLSGSRAYGSTSAYATLMYNANVDISGWNTSSVVSMEGMFRDAAKFNQDITGWNTSKVKTMKYMFQNAALFSQDIRVWNVISVTDFTFMFDLATKMKSDYAAPKQTPTQAYFTGTPALSSDATLSSLLFSQGTLSPAFLSGTASYTASVSNAVSSLTVTPTVTEGTATITVNGAAVTSGAASSAISLNAGSNTITTIVTAGDGTTTQTYTIIVTRAAAAPTITAISPSSGATGGGTSVVITGTNFTGATAVSFGSTAASSYTVDSATQITATAPAGSAGSVNVAVTTAGGTATSTGAYSYVSAPSSDATLSSILFSQGALSPAFSSGTASYTASVSNAVSSLTVTPTVTEGTATITVNGVAVTSGAASSAISLNAGANTITTIVTAGDGTTTQTYTIIVTRAAASQSVTVTNPGAPTIGTATPGNGYVSVAFTAPANTGGAVISDYEYQLDGGSWVSASTTSSPVTIIGLTNGTSYSVKLRAVNSAGSGTASSTTTVTPATTSDAPTALVATPGNAQVSVAFTAPANTGGAVISDYEYQLDGGSWVSASTTSSPVTIIGLTNGTSYSVKLRAVNSAGSGTSSAAANVLLGSPQTAFDAREDDIRQVLTQDATRSLQSTLNVNRRMTSDARERFVASQQVSENDVSRDSVPFDIDGTFTLSETRLSTKGTFFEQRGNAEGTARRLFFGDFDIQHDGESDSTTATLTARMAWEQMYGDNTMLGYFVGGELADSNIKGRFEGEQDRLGLAFGGYAVHQLDEQLFLDGFVSLGAGRNNLEIANDVLSLTSDYTTRTATVGTALSGIYSFGQSELRPELAFSYGKTWIGDVGFTGVAYGLTDDTLSLDAGSVSIANLTVRPEVIWALDAATVADSRSQLSFAPRVICERVQSTATSQDCGGGAELGLTSTSQDGLSNAEFRVIVDKLGNSTRSSFVFNLERQF